MRDSTRLGGVWLIAMLAIASCGRNDATSTRPAPTDAAVPQGRASDNAAEPAIALIETASGKVFEVTGVAGDVLEQLGLLAPDDAAWPERFAVYVGAASEGSPRPRPMVGRYSVDDRGVRFAPRYSLEPGLTYRAVFTPGAAVDVETSAASPRPTVSEEFEIAPRAPAAVTELSAIYPSAELLPENLLKFYLHFSAPMSRGEAYEHIRIFDGMGNVIEAAFLELGEELWDPSGQRFTLFFDPGRIKRGLVPREEMGPVLESGHTYTLVVDAAWRDASRQPLAGGLRKTFRAGPADESRPEPTTWALDIPTSGSTGLLTVDFSEPLDQALLNRLLWVEGEDGSVIDGDAVVAAEETRWLFTPRGAWRKGPHRLVVQAALEDIAGNSVGRPFEENEHESAAPASSLKDVYVPFDVP